MGKKKLRVCMLAYTFYELDNRVRRYAESLARRGDHVDVVALREEKQGERDSLKGVFIHRLMERKRDEKRKYSYLWKLLMFFIRSMVFITKEQWKRPYDLIHVHSVPDFEVFAVWLAKIMGAAIILDIHDIVPEFYANKFKASKESIFFNLLVILEKLSCAFADHVIISNHIWEKILLVRSVKPDKCSVIMNYPDPSIFYPRKRARRDSKFIMIYPGTLGWHQGIDIAIKAFSLIREEVPEMEFHIYGAGEFKSFIENLIKELGLRKRVLLKEPVPIDQICEKIANADLGIVPKRNDCFGGEAFSTKILEFMALGIPVIISETKIDKYYFNESVVQFFKPEDEKDLSQKMLLMIANEDLRKGFSKNALKFIADYSWGKKEKEYLDLVDSLVRKT